MNLNSDGIPNVFYVELDPKLAPCNVQNLNTTMTTVLPATMTNTNLSTPTESSPVIKDCPFTINTDQKSLISYSGMVGMYSTLFFSVPIVSRYGKRKSMMIDSLLSLIAFIFMAAAQNVGMLFSTSMLKSLLD